MSSVLFYLLSIYLLACIIILALCFRSAYAHQRLGISYPKLTLQGFWRIHLEAITSSAKIVWWAISKRDKKDPIKISKDHRPYILCVHGFYMNGSCFYGLRQTLSAQGFDSWAIDMGKPYIAPQVYVERYAQAIQEIIRIDPNRKIVVVAHSMGGLITRLVLQRHPELAPHIGLIITLGSPHLGTASVTRFALKWTRKMFYSKGNFIKSLPSFEALIPNTKVFTIASKQDLIVYPYTFSHLPGTEVIDLEWISHGGLLTKQDCQEMVVDLLDQEADTIGGRF
ncbi:esterase/lipase family protein [Thalassotalea montiporae]